MRLFEIVIDDALFVLEGFPNPAMQKGEKLALFGKVDKDIKNRIVVDDDRIMSRIQSSYDKSKKTLLALRSELSKFLKKNSAKFKNHETHARIKPLGSVLDKVIKRGKSIIEINDLIRGAVVFETKDEVEKFVADIVRKNNVNLRAKSIVEIEKKEKGGDPIYGYYGAYHLLVDIEGVYAEVQVMTKTLWKQKKKAHKIYTTTRSSSSGPSKQDMQRSKQIFSRANKVESTEIDDSENIA